MTPSRPPAPREIAQAAGRTHRMHARLGGARQASTRPQPGPVRAVRGKPSGYTDRPTGTKPVRLPAWLR
jgi:hypothetical protein